MKASAVFQFPFLLLQVFFPIRRSIHTSSVAGASTASKQAKASQAKKKKNKFENQEACNGAGDNPSNSQRGKSASPQTLEMNDLQNKMKALIREEMQEEFEISTRALKVPLLLFCNAALKGTVFVLSGKLRIGSVSAHVLGQIDSVLAV